MPLLRRALRLALTPLIALVLLFEEWGWEPLAALLARLARLPFLAWVERHVAALPPWAALAVFATPALALLPVKLLALFLLGKGHALLGLGVLLAAKILGTAVLARLFTLTQPALMRLPWFARWYPRWKTWKDGVIAQVRASALWRAVAGRKAQVRGWWRAFRHSR
ncbi:hypothetical protein [Caenimonas soli]|jgi:hypothetical protein|uniref:hypothetical protein n=1 Tax=Caenimonas soli TaxID=2735555 RepID=UPI001554B389|nr:hypothetical protein [Caenimonas soli]NPC54188.1 hypothetical protein [Caenimonas soli]